MPPAALKVSDYMIQRSLGDSRGLDLVADCGRTCSMIPELLSMCVKA